MRTLTHDDAVQAIAAILRHQKAQDEQIASSAEQITRLTSELVSIRTQLRTMENAARIAKEKLQR